MNPKYYINDEVWMGELISTTLEVACPVCLGELEVTVSFPNGEVWNVPCEECAKGWMPPTGKITEKHYNVVSTFRVRVSEIRWAEDGIEYYVQKWIPAHHDSPGGWSTRIVPEHKLFETEVEAALDQEERIKELADEAQEEMFKRKKPNSTYAGNATHWRNELKKRFRDWSYTNEHLKAMNQKAREYKNLYKVPENDKG